MKTFATPNKAWRFFEMTFGKQKIAELNRYLSQCEMVVITAHKSPDADSVGSSLGLRHYLKRRKVNAVICHPDAAPSFLHWMPGHGKILSHEDQKVECEKAIAAADLIFCLDYNSANRVGKMEKSLNGAKAIKVMIDHHQDPDKEFCKLIFSEASCSSTSEMIFELMEACGDSKLLNTEMASCLYAGIMMDTGSFRFNSTSPRTHEIAAKLLKTGIHHWEIHEHIHDVNTFNRLQLTGFALLERLTIRSQFKTAWFTLDNKDLSRFHAAKGDTEGLVNKALSMEGIKLAVLFKEESGIIKISFRSKGKVPVNLLASEHFEGGGHLNAAGGKVIGKMKEALGRFEEVLTDFYHNNKKEFES